MRREVAFEMDIPVYPAFTVTALALQRYMWGGVRGFLGAITCNLRGVFCRHGQYMGAVDPQGFVPETVSGELC